MTFQTLAKDALLIQSASNASGVAHFLIDALAFWRGEGGSWNGKDCAAIRVVAFHLAYLTGTGDGITYAADYMRDSAICRALES